MADDSFTRSLYIGRDKAIEVAKRREAVEKELKARREAKIREHKERISRATQQKEAELKEKSRQRQEKELQKQKKVLDRRCAQLELEKAKKAVSVDLNISSTLSEIQSFNTIQLQEILQKAHISASRTNQSQKKPVYVFGSSTPRELSYLEKLTNDQKACNNNRLSAAPSNQHTSMERLAPRSSTPVRTFSRIVPVSLTQKKYPPSTAMTRSVFGTLNNNNNTDHHPPPKIAAAKTPLKVGVVKGTSVTRSTTPNLMTQSMYEQNKSSFTTIKKPAAATKPPTPIRAPKNLPKSGTTATSAPAKMLPPTPPNEPVKKPVIRPRKAVQAEPPDDTKPINGVDGELKKEVEKGGALLDKPQTPSPPAAAVVEEESSSVVVEQEVLDQQQPPPPSQQEEIELLVKQEVDQAIREVIDSTQESDNNGSSTVLAGASNNGVQTTITSSHAADALEVVAVDDEDKVEEGQEQQLVQMDNGPVQQRKLMPEHQMDVSNTDTTLTPVIQLKEDKPANNIVEQPQQALPTPTESPAKNGVGEKLDIEMSKVNGETGDHISPSLNSASSPLSPATVKNNAALEQAEQERENRRQRLNQILQRTRMDGGEGPPKAPPPANGIDASALANDLLAQRRQKLQLQQQQLASNPVKSNGGAGRPTTLVDELSGFGFFQQKNGVQEHMPGQIITPMTITTDDDHYLTSIAKNTNNNSEGKDSETDLSSGLSSPTSQSQPPEDPRTTNGHHSSSSSNTPPTESSITIR